MKTHIMILFCAVLYAVATQIEAKSYRKDYLYDWRTDAFYKLHVDSGLKLRKEEVCAIEGAKLMSPMSKQELSQVHARMNQYQFPYTEEDGNQQNCSAEGQSSIDYSEAKDVLEMTCQVTTRDGYVKTSSVFRDSPFFICKVDAKDVPYNSQCRVHAEGYQYFPSVGSCYKIPRVAYTWHQAAAECQAEGAYLAVINSEPEAAVLKTIVSSAKDVPDSTHQSYYHIGFRAVKITEPRVFKTIFGETLAEAGYSVWANNEPTNGWGNEHCGSVFKTEGKLNDLQCEDRYAFICEKEVTCHGHSKK